MSAKIDSSRRVAIIIVNWNGEKDTLACLDSLSKVDTRRCDLRIIVVDNGSTDTSVDSIHTKFPNIVILQNVENLGFTGANNRGIGYAIQMGYEYIWLLNNDTKVDKNSLRGLVGGFITPDIGIVGSKIYFAPGHEYHVDRYTEKERGKVIWYAGGIVDWDNMYASHRGIDEVDHGQYDFSIETPFITGCSMMIHRRVFEKIGLLDDRYYLYLEDLDFSLRAQRAGFKTLYVPASIIWHVNAGSTAKPGNALHVYYQTRNRLLAGFLYASIRTKFALVREGIKFIFFGPSIKRKAVLDAWQNKFGNQYTWKK